jgi:Cu/Ag efflux pump CusA
MRSWWARRQAVIPRQAWADPRSGIGYQVQVEIPQQRMNSLEDVKNIPIARRSGQQIGLRSVATVSGNYTR